jgi:hypothetical protein
MNTKVSLLTTALILTGCANGFEKFYRETPIAAETMKSPYTLPSPPTPKVYVYSSDLKSDNQRLTEDGYVEIGYVSFSGNANKVSESQAVAQGKKVSAALIMIHSQYLETVSGVVPYTVANPPAVSTVNTSGTVNSYGTGGYASGTYNGTNTVTTPGGASTYALPYSFNRNQYDATYWVKRANDKIRFGVNVLPLSDDLRHTLQRNSGLVVTSVVRGTPAFSANILDGDILIKFAGEDVTDSSELGNQVAKYAGQIVNIELIRDDQTKNIPVTLRPNL